MSEKWVEKARPSLAHQADKFNTEAPAGYVAGRRAPSLFSHAAAQFCVRWRPAAQSALACCTGRGRGAAGFSKPPPKPPPRRGPGRVPDDDDDDDADDRRRRARLQEDDDDDDGGAGTSADPGASDMVGEDGQLEGEAADTNVLDMNQTERFEVQKLSM